jgi:hypothetical protein
VGGEHVVVEAVLFSPRAANSVIADIILLGLLAAGQAWRE